MVDVVGVAFVGRLDFFGRAVVDFGFGASAGAAKRCGVLDTFERGGLERVGNGCDGVRDGDVFFEGLLDDETFADPVDRAGDPPLRGPLVGTAVAGPPDSASWVRNWVDTACRKEIGSALLTPVFCASVAMRVPS